MLNSSTLVTGMLCLKTRLVRACSMDDRVLDMKFFVLEKYTLIAAYPMRHSDT